VSLIWKYMARKRDWQANSLFNASVGQQGMKLKFTVHNLRFRTFRVMMVTAKRTTNRPQTAAIPFAFSVACNPLPRSSLRCLSQ